MKNFTPWFIVASLFLAVFALTGIAQATSLENASSIELNVDHLITNGAGEVVLSKDIVVNDDNTPVLIQSAGSWYCTAGLGSISGRIVVDGVESGNDLLMTFGFCPTEHPFLFQVAENLSKGTHHIELSFRKETTLTAGIKSGTQLVFSSDFSKVEQYAITSGTIQNTFRDIDRYF